MPACSGRGDFCALSIYPECLAMISPTSFDADSRRDKSSAPALCFRAQMALIQVTGWGFDKRNGNARIAGDLDVDSGCFGGNA